MAEAAQEEGWGNKGFNARKEVPNYATKIAISANF